MYGCIGGFYWHTFHVAYFNLQKKAHFSAPGEKCVNKKKLCGVCKVSSSQFTYAYFISATIFHLLRLQTLVFYLNRKSFSSPLSDYMIFFVSPSNYWFVKSIICWGQISLLLLFCNKTTLTQIRERLWFGLNVNEVKKSLLLPQVTIDISMPWTFLGTCILKTKNRNKLK